MNLPINKSQRRFQSYAWFVVGYSILVILWGAWVRITGSGAGCGNHWPRCNGVIIPKDPTVETMIELSHRLTSSFAGVLVIILVVWAFRAFDKGHNVRRYAVLSLIFILIEGAIGALLVRLELVADNASMWRAAAIALHQANTFILLAVMALTAYWANAREKITLRGGRTLLIIGGIGLLLVAATGAVTALGDTLFPAESILEGIRQDFTPGMNFLVRLRIIHPIIAIVAGMILLVISELTVSETDVAHVRKTARTVTIIVITQWIVGIINVILLAPGWLQLIHLLIADLLLIFFVILAAKIELTQTA